MTIVRPSNPSYQEVKCGTTSGENVCTIPLKDGKAQPTTLFINSKTNDTVIKSSLDNAKIDLSAFKDVSKISGIYTVGYNEGVETSVYIKHAGGVHTLHIEGHQKLTQDLFIGKDSKELIEGLVTTRGGTDYYNLLCGMQSGVNKCVPVKIDGVIKPTGYLLNPSVSAHTTVHNSPSDLFFFNLKKLEEKNAINSNDKVDPRFDNKVEFYHNDKVVHTVVITNPSDMIAGLLNNDDTYGY